LNEVKSYMNENEMGTAIFDDKPSARQLRNIEKVLNCKVLDRTNLILDIYAPLDGFVINGGLKLKL